MRSSVKLDFVLIPDIDLEPKDPDDLGVRLGVLPGVLLGVEPGVFILSLPGVRETELE